jgi:chromosome segregation ATPase
MEEVQELNEVLKENGTTVKVVINESEVFLNKEDVQEIQTQMNEIFGDEEKPSNKGFKTHSIDSVHHFSDEELKELAVNITELDKEIDAKDSEMEGYKIRASSIKKQIENLDSERRSKSRKYRDGFENRTYTCKRVDDYENGFANYIDITTDELIKTESLDGIFSKEDDQY